MWKKIKAFFSNKVVKVVEWILLALVAVGLIIGGTQIDDMKSGLVLVGGIVDAVILLITFISSKC